MAPEAISEHLISKNLLWEHPSDPPSLVCLLIIYMLYYDPPSIVCLLFIVCLLIIYMHIYTLDIDVTLLQKILATGLNLYLKNVSFVSISSLLRFCDIQQCLLWNGHWSNSPGWLALHWFRGKTCWLSKVYQSGNWDIWFLLWPLWWCWCEMYAT